MNTVLPPQQNEGPYTFASQPRAVPQRKKYRERFLVQEDGPDSNSNLMYDRRVVRGNTYSQHILPTAAQPDPIELQRQQEMRRRAMAKKRVAAQMRPKSPDAIDGRQHIDVQTELYLEELSDRIEEADVDCQTDPFLDRPPSPLFVPAKSGIDFATQILEGDLFDFDLEVKPILEVLVGKTIEQSLLEVMEEEELANLRSQQRVFEELRNAELVEQQRLEEQERRHREEKLRRMGQQRDFLNKEKETAEKIAARAFAQSYLSDLVPTVFGTLSEHGYFFDPVERDVEQGFLPWLMTEVHGELELTVKARAVLDGLLREVVRQRHQAYRLLDQQQEQARLANEALGLMGNNESGNADDIEATIVIPQPPAEEPAPEADAEPEAAAPKAEPTEAAADLPEENEEATEEAGE